MSVMSIRFAAGGVADLQWSDLAGGVLIRCLRDVLGPIGPALETRYLMTTVTSGRMVLEVEGRRIDVLPGDVALLPPLTLHSELVPARGAWSGVTAHVSAETVRHILQRDGGEICRVVSDPLAARMLASLPDLLAT